MEARNVTDSMSSSDGLVFFGKGHREFRLEQLLGSQAEVMGNGIFGYSYKAYLGPKDAFVVKRLKGSHAFGKEKIEELGGTVHENLMPLKAYYSAKDETLLICDYMPGGQLV